MENLSPVVERRSRRIGPVDNSTEEVPVEELNDDEEERSRYRQQLENDARNQSSNEKRFSASEKTLSEHFQSCIQLAAENKINAKNAFSFKLIDLLHMMLSKKKQIPDFTEVTCSLDAGVKIYSYRVDNVHSDTMKMATSICSGANKNRDEHNDMPEEPSEDSPTKKKRHTKKRIKCVLENRESINRNNAEERFGIPPPFLTTEKWITDTAIFDNAGICIHVNQSLSFRESCFKVKIENCSTKRVPVEIADVQDELLCPTFNGIFLKEETEETDCEEVSLKDKIAHQYNYEHNILENTTYENTMDDNAAADDFFEDATVAPEAEEIHQTVFCRSANAIPHSALFSTDISHLISSETLDYRYFNTQVMQNKWSLKSAGYWNPKKNKETISKPRSQKKELIDFENFDDFHAFEDEAKIPLTIVTSSSRDKFLITPVTHFNFKEFFRLKTCRGMFVVPTSSNEEQPSDLEETIKDYDYNNPNDSQHLIPEQYEDDYVDEDHDGVAGDVHEALENGILQGDNLVEIPNKVAKIELPYMVKDKFVDMKKLKSEIWEKIDLNEKLNTQEAENVQELEFSHICREIISNSKADLSVPILFNAILQLANDRNLEFAYTEQNASNFFIRVNEGKSN